MTREEVFQFTHPGRGATPSCLKSCCRHPVSIHAPREGCDSALCLLVRMRYSFNSRTPGGVRHEYYHHQSYQTEFQFTHPGRGATYPRKGGVADLLFQFTHPGRGATQLNLSQIDSLIVSIHAPREGCDGERSQIRISPPRVSIHAPREGCDLSGRVCTFRSLQFQFTHPGRGATAFKGGVGFIL